MPSKKAKKAAKRPKASARSGKKTAGALAARKTKPAAAQDARQAALSDFAHWWTLGFQQIVFEIDQLARAKKMPLIDPKSQDSPRVDVSVAHRSAIDALVQLYKAGVANLHREIGNGVLWPVAGAYGGNVKTQEELDRTISRLRQFPDDPEKWQTRIVDGMLQFRKLGRSYCELLATRIRDSDRAGKRKQPAQAKSKRGAGRRGR